MRIGTIIRLSFCRICRPSRCYVLSFSLLFMQMAERICCRTSEFKWAPRERRRLEDCKLLHCRGKRMRSINYHVPVVQNCLKSLNKPALTAYRAPLLIQVSSWFDFSSRIPSSSNNDFLTPFFAESRWRTFARREDGCRRRPGGWSNNRRSCENKC